MRVFKYRNIKLTKQYNKTNFVAHSGIFHVDDVISNVFPSEIFKEINLIRVPSMDNSAFQRIMEKISNSNLKVRNK